MSKKTLFVAVSALVCVVIFVAINNYWKTKCPSDYSLLSNFTNNERYLDQLLAMIESDGGRVSYVGKGVVEASGLPLSASRKADYLEKVKMVGAECLAQADGEAVLWFWFSSKNISRSKGITLIPNIKKSHYFIKSQLDGLEKGGEDGIYVMPMTKNWYIIYDQSR